MSLRPEPVGEIPAETARVARAAFPKGTVVTRLRDEFADLYRDEDFAALYPRRGQPGLAPWRLALVTVLQFLEHLSDRQAADAVRSRIDFPRMREIFFARDTFSLLGFTRLHCRATWPNG